MSLRQSWGQHKTQKSNKPLLFLTWTSHSSRLRAIFFFMQRAPHCFPWEIPTQDIIKLSALEIGKGCFQFLLSSCSQCNEAFCTHSFSFSEVSFILSALISEISVLLGKILLQLLVPSPIPLLSRTLQEELLPIHLPACQLAVYCVRVKWVNTNKPYDSYPAHLTLWQFSVLSTLLEWGINRTDMFHKTQSCSTLNHRTNFIARNADSLAWFFMLNTVKSCHPEEFFSCIPAIK